MRRQTDSKIQNRQRQAFQIRYQNMSKKNMTLLEKILRSDARVFFFFLSYVFGRKWEPALPNKRKPRSTSNWRKFKKEVFLTSPCFWKWKNTPTITYINSLATFTARLLFLIFLQEFCFKKYTIRPDYL